MIQAAFVLVLAASATDCREAAKGVQLEKLGELATSLPRFPGPPRLPPPGSSIISFEINADGRARAITVECQSSELTGNFLKGLVSVFRFPMPANAQQGRRHAVGLSVDVSKGDADKKVSVTDFHGPGREQH